MLFKNILVTTFILLSLTGSSQKSFRGGLNFTAETTGGGMVAGIGATIETKLRKHSGIESGLYFRPYRNSYYIYTDNYYYDFTIAERHLSIPFLYKFHSRIVNFSVGPTFEFYLGWSQKKADLIQIEGYSIDPSFNLGAMLKVSKEIRLDEKLLLEPELRLNPIISAGRGYGGIGIAGKYIIK